MRRTIDFNNKWLFTKEADCVPTQPPLSWYVVNLPHTWNDIDGQDGGNDYYRGKGYYAKEFDIADFSLNESDLLSKKVYLEIPAANSKAFVYLNGKEIASHKGGYSCWRVELDDLKINHNLLVIVCDNEVTDDVYPVTADFTFYGGLYRGLRIIIVENTHFDLDYFGSKGLKATAQICGDNAEVRVESFISNLKDGLKTEVSIADMEGRLVAVKQIPSEKANIIDLKIENVHLWNGRKDPYLYKVKARILSEDEIIDELEIKLGCRSFDVDPQEGFILNGKPYPLRGVARHQDYWGIGNALGKKEHEKDMDIICEMGANTIRLAHYQHDEYFYDLCDKKGMLIWAEIPYISRHKSEGRENTLSQMKELIVQNYNHPSIVVWGLSNEVTMMLDEELKKDMMDNHRELNSMVKSTDPYRKTAVAAISNCSMDDDYLKIPDLISYNLYYGWYEDDISKNGRFLDEFHSKYPNTPIGLSEYGCEALNWHGSELVRGDYTEEYQAYYHEEMIKQIFARKYIWASYVWNMFDFGCDARNEGGEAGQNHKGLVTIDRSYKKDAFYAYKAWMSDEPFVHLCGKRFIDRVDEITKVTVYSNLPEVELFVNGKSVGKKKSEEHFFYFDIENKGESKLKAVAGEYSDESLIRKVDKINPKYRFAEKGPVLNWFEVTAPKGKYSINNKMKEILLSKDARDVVRPLWSKLEEKYGKPVDDFVKGISLIRVIGYEKLLKDMNDKAEILEINKKLNEIDIPKEIN